MLMLVAQSALATTGIDCKSIDGTMEVYTEEGLLAESSDNVITLSVVAPWIQNEAIVFSKFKDEVNVVREEAPIYVAVNSKGQTLTLLLGNRAGKGVEASTAIFRTNGKIYYETLHCRAADDQF